MHETWWLHAPPHPAVSGERFWSAPRGRAPSATEFNSSDPLHVDFVWHAAALYATVFGVDATPLSDLHVLRSAMHAVVLPPFVPRVAGAALGDDGREGACTAELEELATALSAGEGLPVPCVVPVVLDVHADSNHHVGLVTAAASLRTCNYGIKAPPRFKVRLTAGMPMDYERRHARVFELHLARSALPLSFF